MISPAFKVSQIMIPRTINVVWILTMRANKVEKQSPDFVPIH